MGTPFFCELKKQTSFFIKDKLRTARLVLTDVTSAELLTEEATNRTPQAPDARTMGFISRAAFEIDDYLRIVEILHKRLEKYDRKHWRESYKALVLLEHLLTHGPGSVADEFQFDVEVIRQMGTFQYIDERGFNWGESVRSRSDRVLKLLEKGPLLKEERERAQKITRGIQGFGSFKQRSLSKTDSAPTSDRYGRSNSQYEHCGLVETAAVAEIQEEDFEDEMKKKTETREKSIEEEDETDDRNLTGAGGEAKTLEAIPLLTLEESNQLASEEKIGFQELHPFNNLKRLTVPTLTHDELPRR